MLIAVVIFTLMLSAIFSGSEIAYVTANRLRLQSHALSVGRIGRIAADFANNPSKLLTTTLVGNNLALVAYSTVMALLLEGPMHRLAMQMGMSESAAVITVLAGQTIIAAFIVLVVGEIIPKSIMREIPNRSALALAVPLRITYIALLPLVKVAEYASGALVRLAGVRGESLSRFLRRDFEQIILEGRTSGKLDLDEDEQALLTNVFAMDTVTVRECMVPRTDVAALDDTARVEDARQMFIESGHSRLPVYHENIDNVVGVVFAYDLFSMPEQLADIVRPVAMVPESRSAKGLLREFLKENVSVAVALDEYGGMAGIVTREDLLEELFGEIRDEFDQEDEVLRRIDDRTFVLGGRVEVDSLVERFGISLPEGDYETIAGFLLEATGAVPEPRTELVVGRFTFKVLRSTANRVDLVRLTVGDDIPSTDGPEAASTSA